MSANIDYVNKNYRTSTYQIQETKLQDPVKILPRDVVIYIFSFLNESDLKNCRLIKKEWKQLADNDALHKGIVAKSWGDKTSINPSSLKFAEEFYEIHKNNRFLTTTDKAFWENCFPK